MEPTGVNYQLLWGTQLARAGVEVRLVRDKELRSFREHHLGLPDKDDDADALALAIYGWDYLESPRRFVQVRSQPIVEFAPWFCNCPTSTACSRQSSTVLAKIYRGNFQKRRLCQGCEQVKKCRYFGGSCAGSDRQLNMM
jgi:hypothetical protein